MNKRLLLIVIGGVVALSVVGVTLYLMSQSQDTRSRAQIPGTITPTPTTVPPNTLTASNPPGTPQNVLVEYPSCTDLNCSFLEASCAWDPVTDATSYKLKVTEVDTGSVVYDQTQATSVSKIVFPVNQNKVYQCDVTALNADGQAGATGSHSLLCETDGIVEPTTPPTVVPTIPPTKAPTPTVAASPSATLAPTIPAKTTSTPTPTIESPGAPVQSIAIIGAAVMTMIIGVLLLGM